MPTMNIMQTIRKVQAATLAARTRTGCAAIGTRAESGRLQVVRVTYPDGKRGGSVVEPVSEWLTPADAAAFLEAMQ